MVNLFCVSNQISDNTIIVKVDLMLLYNYWTNPSIIKTYGIQSYDLHLVSKFALGQLPVIWRFYREISVSNAKGAINMKSAINCTELFHLRNT